jgi:hypothetical protein
MPHTTEGSAVSSQLVSVRYLSRLHTDLEQQHGGGEGQVLEPP